MKMKSRLHRYNISKPTCRHGQKYSNKKSISIWWCLYVISNAWATFEAQFMKRLSKTVIQVNEDLKNLSN